VTLESDHQALHSRENEYDLKLMWDADERQFHRMAMVYNVLEIWQSSQNQPAIQKELCSQNKQMTAVGYISDTADILKASW
jgi:hypothetical protein